MPLVLTVAAVGGLMRWAVVDTPHYKTWACLGAVVAAGLLYLF